MGPAGRLGLRLAGRIIRLVALLAGLGVTRMLVETIHVLIWLPGGRSFYWETTVGFVLALSVILIGLLVAAGAAWSRTPVLWMSDHLEEDREHRYVRLKLKNRAGGHPQAQVRLMAVVDRDGNDLVERSILPIELHWTHHPGARPDLSSDVPESVGVASFPSLATIRFEGMVAPVGVLSRSDDGKFRTVWFELWANLLGKRKYIKRWFALEPTNEPSLYHRPLSGSPPFLRRRRRWWWC